MHYPRYSVRHLVDHGADFYRIVDQVRGRGLDILDTRDKAKARRMAAALNEAARRAVAA